MSNLINNDIASVQVAHPVAASLAIEDINVALDLAQDRYLRPIFGRYLHTLQTRVEGSTTSGEENKMVKEARKALVAYALADNLPSLMVKVSSAGLMEQSASNGTANPTRQWSFTQLRESLYDMADAAIELMLEYIDKTAGFWATLIADGMPDNRTVITWRTEHVEPHVNIRSSRRAFLAMLPAIRRVETMNLVGQIGRPYYDYLLTEMKAGTLAGVHKTLVETYIHPAVSHLAVADSIGAMALRVNAGALTSRTFDGTDARTGATTEALNRYMADMRASGDQILTMMQSELINNASSYPLWEAEKGAEVMPNTFPPDQRRRKHFRV